MIQYYGRFGQYLGQAPAPASDLPYTQTPAERDLARLDDKVTLSKGALLVGGIVLAGLTMTLSSSLLRRS